MFNVVIIGGENTNNYEYFSKTCINLLKNKAKSGDGITIYTTGDEYVEKFATTFRIDTKNFYCNWNIHGKDAIKERNKELLANANGLIYFDTGKKDNQIIYNYANKLGISSRRVIKKEEN